MKQREQARIQVLNTVLEHHLPISQAAEIMGISERHAKRLLAAYRNEGAGALAHGNRGRTPHNAVPEAAVAAVVKLAGHHYAGANHTHLTELLREGESIDLSRPTVRRILVKAGIGSPRSRRSPPAPVPEAAHAPGGDAGPGGRQPPPLAGGARTQVRIAAGGGRRHRRGGLGGLPPQRGYPGLPGAPGGPYPAVGDSLALYSDRHAAFKYNARQGSAQFESTQFARVMPELGIGQIFALSPQAKGRVEQMTSIFQDRLVTELRLAGAATKDQANDLLQEFLPRFNAQFAVAAEQQEGAYRPVPEKLSLAETVCIKHTRKVARDNTVKYHWRVLLLPGRERPSYSGLQVRVLERADGELMIRYHGENPSNFRNLRSPCLPCGEQAVPAPLTPNRSRSLAVRPKATCTAT